MTYTFNSNALPSAVATQIGAGEYTKVTLTSNKLILSVPHGEVNYSVAFTCPAVTYGLFLNAEYITSASVLDGTAFSETCSQSPLPGGMATIKVDASAIPGADEINVGSNGGCSACNTFDGDASLAVGKYDVPVTVDDSGGPYGAPLAVTVLRGQMIPGALNGGMPVVFQAAEKTIPQAITYNNVPTGYSLAGRTVVYNTAGGASVQLELNNSGAALTQYHAMPSDTHRSGDYYDFLVWASDTTSGGTVSAEDYTSTAGLQTFTFPSPWPYAGPTAAALPTFNFAYSGFTGASSISYRVATRWGLGTPSSVVAPGTDAISMNITANYQNGSTAIKIPDLSGLQGFLPSPFSGTTVLWSAGVYQGPSLTNPPSGTIQGVYNSGSYPVP